jgi:predicted nucleotidyltransferase
MARGNAREYLFGDQVRLKKYFYVHRPLLAIRHIEAGRGIPPVLFEELVEAAAPSHLTEAIEALLALKRDTAELGLGEPVPALERFIDEELERHGTAFSGRGRPPLADAMAVQRELIEHFRTAVREGA